MAAPQSAVQTAKKMADSRGLFSAKNLPYMLAGFLVSFGSLIGLGFSHLIERARIGAVAKDQKNILADHYREQIAAQLGIDPKQVNHKHLDEAARNNPAFASLVDKVTLEKERGERATLIGTGAAATLGLGWVPGLSAVSDTVGKVGAHMIGHVGGSMASGIFNKDKLAVEDVALHIDAKVEQGIPVAEMDVMLLRIAQNENLQQQIGEQFKKPLHMMNEVEQRAVLAAMPDLYEASARDAQAVNSGRVKSKDLVMVSPGAQTASAPQQSWANRVGGPRAQQGSFVKAYQAEQPTAATRGGR